MMKKKEGPEENNSNQQFDENLEFEKLMRQHQKFNQAQEGKNTMVLRTPRRTYENPREDNLDRVFQIASKMDKSF